MDQRPEMLVQRALAFEMAVAWGAGKAKGFNLFRAVNLGLKMLIEGLEGTEIQFAVAAVKLRRVRGFYMLLQRSSFYKVLVAFPAV